MFVEWRTQLLIDAWGEKLHSKCTIRCQSKNKKNLARLSDMPQLGLVVGGVSFFNDLSKNQSVWGNWPGIVAAV